MKGKGSFCIFLFTSAVSEARDKGFNGFIKYNEAIFSWADQERLAKSLLAAWKRGAHVIVSNADHPSVRALYESNFRIGKVHRSSVISGDANFRTQTSELLIVGVPKRRLFIPKGAHSLHQ